MKLILSSVFLLLTNFLYAQSSSQKEMDGNIDSLLCPVGYSAIGQPYLSFKLTNGNRLVDNQRLKGKVVFINFWFEGCHPCMAEMEALNELFEKLQDKRDFVFISVTWENQEAITRVRKKYSLLFDVFMASSKECQRLNFGCGYPTSIVLDKSGIVKYKHNGGSLKKEEARKFIMTSLLPEIQNLL